MKIKQNLLEYLVRECIREVISQVREAGDETKGAPTPPEKTGAGENPAIPAAKDTTPEEPSQPETPPTPQHKGLVLVDPKNKSRLKILKPATQMNDAALERALHNVVTTTAGSKVKVALATMRSIKDVLKNPNATLYLYIGKFDPESEELFLLGDKSLQVAKDSTVDPTELTTTPLPLGPGVFDPLTASPEDVASRVDPSGYAHKVPGQDQPEDEDFADAATGYSGKMPGSLNEDIRSLIKRMVNDILIKK